mmetsp:Transcript_26668/g.25516  ORF Transcript_26668/g.25516 Transcript_26668/m.25516 type:complete len:81 (-) Transcript_26668:321-563(-)
MNCSICNISLPHSVTIFVSSTVKMHDFDSIKFSKLYMNGYIPPFVRNMDLRMTDANLAMTDYVSNVIEFINRHGGFNDVG